MALGAPNSSLPVPVGKEGIKKMEPDSSKQCMAGGREARNITKTREVLTGYKVHFYP